MPVEIIASSLPSSLSWNETLLGSGKTRLATQACLVAGAIIVALGYLDYLGATYAYTSGVSMVIVGLALPHLVRWREIRRHAGLIGQTTINALPPEIITQFLRLLPPSDQLGVSAVCRKWYFLSGGHFTLDRVESSTGIEFRIS